MTQTESTPHPAAPALLTPESLLSHWQGHRRLTRRVIEAFPGDQLFTFSVGNMRPFGALAWEMITTTTYLLNALKSDVWGWEGMSREERPQELAALLSAWEEITARIDAEVPGVSPELMATEKDVPFGRQTPTSAAFYIIDNEIHHRGQGYVYLRVLGIEPPAFYQR